MVPGFEPTTFFPISSFFCSNSFLLDRRLIKKKVFLLLEDFLRGDESRKRIGTFPFTIIAHFVFFLFSFYCSSCLASLLLLVLLLSSFIVIVAAVVGGVATVLLLFC